MKNSKGITLVALVITIIVLLILAGISLSLTLGENGILTKAREAAIAQKDAEIEEELKMAYAAFKTAQSAKEIEEPNIYKAQVDYVRSKMEDRYGNKLKEVYKSGKYTKAEFKNNDRVYVLRHDGTVYHYVRMKPTEVWGRLDEETETVYLRANKSDEYVKVLYNLGTKFDCEKIKSVVIEESIAPADGFTFAGCINLEKIEYIDRLHTENFSSSFRMFWKCSNLKNIDVTNFDTSKITTMGWMFCECNKITNIDISGFDTRNVDEMNYMFNGCTSLNNIDVTGFDTKNVKNMNGMFFKCDSLTNLNLSNFDTRNVEDMGMLFRFSSNSKLEKIDLSSFNTTNVTSMNYMFGAPTNLKYVNLGNNFIISDNCNYSVMFENWYWPYNKLKIRAKQQTAEKIKDKFSHFNDLNFEIIE